VELADECAKRYDLFFLCEDDFSYVHTWDRSGEANRRLFQENIRKDLRIRGIPFVSLLGDLDSRVDSVKKNLAYNAWPNRIAPILFPEDRASDAFDGSDRKTFPYDFSRGSPRTESGNT
jgi:hypothetical protein